MESDGSRVSNAADDMETNLHAATDVKTVVSMQGIKFNDRPLQM